MKYPELTYDEAVNDLKKEIGLSSGDAKTVANWYFNGINMYKQRNEADKAELVAAMKEVIARIRRYESVETCARILEQAIKDVEKA